MAVFGSIDEACLSIFTIEYGVKFLTAWAFISRYSILNFCQILFESLYAILTILFADSKNGVVNQRPGMFSLRRLTRLYIRYIFTLRNLLELINILPFLISSGGGSVNPEVAAFVRSFRLLRIFKSLDRSEHTSELLSLVKDTFMASNQACCILLGMFMMSMILFGSLVFDAEAGNFTVNEQFPTGAFVRMAANHYNQEVSPFMSIPTSFYWVITTVSTGT